ncbi:MAG: ADP-dependent glucokinase/phosphofructokinase [Candidatus Aenigmatarchaeota archaeon]
MPYKIDIPKVKVATGLYSHWDSVITVNKKIFNWIKQSKEKKSKKIVLNSLEEVIFNLKMERDNESLISKKVYEKLISFFPKREIRLGGNGNNMGRALFKLGLNPLVSYPIRPKNLMLASPEFNVAVGNKLKKPKDAIRKNDPEFEHIIFEAEKWRNILSWDLMSSRGIFDTDFLKIAFNPNLIKIAIISYAHLLLPKYKKRTNEIIEFLKQKRPKIHLEFGLGCEESMKYAMEKFSEYGACKSWGLNEKECKIYFKANSENRRDLIEATFNAIKEYNVDRICIHGPKFVFSISKYDIKSELEALKTACSFSNLKISNKLKLNFKVLKKKIGNYNLCLITSFYTPYPKKITGIGDTFAAVQAVKIFTQTN